MLGALISRVEGKRFYTRRSMGRWRRPWG